MSKLTLDEAIKHCLEVAEGLEKKSNTYGIKQAYIPKSREPVDCLECAAEHRQLAEWLTELKEAKGIIRVCNRVLGYLLECEIEGTSTRHEVETLLKNITEYLSGGGENGT